MPDEVPRKPMDRGKPPLIWPISRRRLVLEGVVPLLFVAVAIIPLFIIVGEVIPSGFYEGYPSIVALAGDFLLAMIVAQLAVGIGVGYRGGWSILSAVSIAVAPVLVVVSVLLLIDLAVRPGEIPFLSLETTGLLLGLLFTLGVMAGGGILVGDRIAGWIDTAG